MSLIARKISAFAKKVADLADRPGGTIPTAELKAQFDSSPEELRVAHNGLIDDLASTTAGASGAHQIGSETIAGVTGNTVYAQMSSLKTQIDGAVTGNIPAGSLTADKLAPTVIGDSTTLLTTSKVPVGAINELFQSVSSGKTEVATAITDKGVAASGSDTFAQLATKIGQISSSAITSIQTGTLISSTLTNTITISAVDPAQTIVMVETSGVPPTTTSMPSCLAAIKLINATTVEITRFGNTAADLTWTVIEYKNVKSKQTGTKVGFGLVTVSSVVANKTILFATHKSGAANLNQAFVRSRIRSATEIDFSSSGSDLTIEWQLIEFN